MAGETDSIGSDRGITRTLTGFVIETENIDETDISEQIPNQQGAIVGEKHYDTRYDLSLTVRATSSASIPTANSVLSYASSSWKVDAVKEAGTYNGLRRYTITAHRYTGFVPA